jgi:uncharacterized Zn finger protein
MAWQYGGDPYVGEWPVYVSAAQRRRLAEKEMAALRKKGRVIAPVCIEGRAIAKTFWGKAWCDNLESYSDYANRLPRGRTYVRNGSVVDLEIKAGQVSALVRGSSLYTVAIGITPVAPARWKALVGECAGKINSLVELLQGTLSQGVMELVTRKDSGLFPKPTEITLSCSCPDWASMCKHVAAALYGTGARLDETPELLFTLRKVDHLALVAGAARPGRVDGLSKEGKRKVLDASRVASVFGIEFEEGPVSVEGGARRGRARRAKAGGNASRGRTAKPSR